MSTATSAPKPPLVQTHGPSGDAALAVASAHTHTLTTRDGASLAAMLYHPPARSGTAVLIGGGLGISQRFYAPFATWLAARGHLVMSFDLRGMGASRNAPLRTVQADMLSWARMDFTAAVESLAVLADQEKITVLGHSLGTHHAAMTTTATQARIERLVSVAAGAGYWRDWAPRSRRIAPLMLHLAAPLLTPLFGYFPGKRLGMVGDLPAPAARQWSRWCRHPRFAWGDQPDEVLPSLAGARFPVRAFSFTDDDAMTLDCTRKLMAAMPNAPATIASVSPAEVKMKAIGHVGAFRAQAEARLWPLLHAAIVEEGD